MDNRLVLAVLFVTLSWISVGTNAQVTLSSNMTTDSGNNTTNMTNAPNTTMESPMSTAEGTNMTQGPNTTVVSPMSTAEGTNMTQGPNTTVVSPMSTAEGTNMTQGPNTTVVSPMSTAEGTNMTQGPNTTMVSSMSTTATGTNMTQGPNTTMVSSMSTTAAGTNMTQGPNTTMVSSMSTTAATPNVTTAPPLTPNTTVEVLNTNISNTGCGTEQLCAAEPSSCNPSNSESCFFLSAKQQSGRNFNFGLAGVSEGYLAATLSTGSSLGGNDTTYICANNNGVVKFIGALLSSNKLIPTELNVNSVKGKVNGKKIQCTFAATVPDVATRASTFTLAISNGPFNSTSGDLGSPNTLLKSAPVDLGNPNATVTNELSANTTSAPSTTAMSSGHTITFQQTLTQALLISLGMLSLAML